MRTLDADPEAAERTLAEASAAGIVLQAVTTEELEREGVRSFCGSYRELDCIEGKLGVVARA